MEYSATGPRRHDLIEMEPLLCKALARFFRFSSHGLYFPRENVPATPIWLPRERKLLVPLKFDPAPEGEVLGVFMAEGVQTKNTRSLLPVLPGIVALCLENLGLHKRAGVDETTGLARRETLLARMARELEQGREEFSENSGALEGRVLPQRGSMGLVVLRCADMEKTASRCGHCFADAVRKKTAEALAALVPRDTPLFRCADDEFALLLHEAAARTACTRLSGILADGLETFSCAEPLTRRSFRPRFSIGCAVYPQDMDGEDFLLPAAEQAALMLAKARLAARAAEESAPGRSAAGRIMSYARIVHEGGVIRNVLPLSRLTVSLGRQAGARPGLRFSIHPPEAPGFQDSPSKGELELLDVDELSSTARLIRLEEPEIEPEAGDGLRLAHESSAAGFFRGETQTTDVEDTADPPDFRSFQERFAVSGAVRFCLALIAPAQGEEHMEQSAEQRKTLFDVCLECAKPDFGSRCGSRSLIFFHAGQTAQGAAALYAEALRQAAEKGIRAAAGLAAYPFLHFQRDEITECCAKALDLARLLPEPKVGVFGSLALNISADRHYSRGDLFRAVQEYEWALLADRNNANAWNSLGVCMAALSRHHDAQRYFSAALKRSPGDAAVLYNLGVIHRQLGNRRAAARRFKDCLGRNPDHNFARIRLGQIAAEAGRPAEARRLFLQAAESGDGAGTARRLLARLALKKGRTGEARAHLYEALRHNPQDALALCLLAGLYLDCGEDPSVAEMLARQSALIMPDLGAARQELARALAAQGKKADAGNPLPE